MCVCVFGGVLGHTSVCVYVCVFSGGIRIVLTLQL